MKEQVGRRLLAVREALGFTRDDVVAETGMNKTTLRNIECALVNQSLSSVAILCREYDISIDSLVYDTDEQFEELLNDLRGVMI